MYCNGLLSSSWRLNFEIYRSVLVKQFSYMTENSEKTVKYIKNEKRFEGEIKGCQILAASDLRPENAPLSQKSI